MTSRPAVLADEIIGILRDQRETADLRPFGDGPLEAEMVAQLSSHETPANVEQALAIAVEWSLAGVLERRPEPTAYAQLASVALMAGFAKVRLDDAHFEQLASIISTRKLNLKSARDALRMLLRVLARTETAVNTRVFERLAGSDDVQLRAAAIELLARKGAPSFISRLARLIRDNACSQQLLWTLSQDATAVEKVASAPNQADNILVARSMIQAINDLDPSGIAKSQWDFRMRQIETHQQKKWGALQYARSASPVSGFSSIDLHP